ncbi:AAA family ATPase, partial [Barnesiella intestinihominis]
MSTECLTIKNFGPIKKAKLRIRKYNIFIGDTACGKSIAAKLISIFNSEEFLLLKTGDYENFIALLSKYNIDFPFHQDTLISYKYWNISYRSFITDNNRYELVKAIQNNDQEVITKILGKNFIQPDT